MRTRTDAWLERLRAPVRRLRDRFPAWLTIGLVIAIAVNIVLVAGYFWSRSGQTSHVSVEARGSEFRAEIDGSTHVEAVYSDAAAAGGVSLFLEDTNLVPSLPEPRGIDRVQITGPCYG